MDTPFVLYPGLIQQYNHLQFSVFALFLSDALGAQNARVGHVEAFLALLWYVSVPQGRVGGSLRSSCSMNGRGYRNMLPRHQNADSRFVV